jgi:Zn-finger nucleic acid-binding protein
VPLVAEQRAGSGQTVTVDACPQCRGLYLDHGELMLLTGNRPLEELLDRELKTDTEDTLLCPACFGFMEYETPRGVQVDICSTCEGLWLDAGELERLSGPPPADPRAQRAHATFTVLRKG